MKAQQLFIDPINKYDKASFIVGLKHKKRVKKIQKTLFISLFTFSMLGSIIFNVNKTPLNGFNDDMVELDSLMTEQDYYSESLEQDEQFWDSFDGFANNEEILNKEI